MIGNNGNTGYRLLTNSPINKNENELIINEIEAVSIGELQIAEMIVDSTEVIFFFLFFKKVFLIKNFIKENFIWKCSQLTVTDTNTSNNYIFKFLM